MDVTAQNEHMDVIDTKRRAAPPPSSPPGSQDGAGGKNFPRYLSVSPA